MIDTPDISPTQIELWRSCPRKFAFTYLTGRPKPPPGPGAVLGTACHTRMEGYLKTGIPDYSFSDTDIHGKQAAKVLAAIIPFLPTPGPDVMVEGKVSVTVDGIVLAGRLDWSSPTEVGDLKTCSTFRYVPTIDTLRLGAQPVIYSLARPGRECHWLYAPTSGKEPRPLRFWADMSKGLDEVLRDAYVIREAWRNKPADPNALEAKVSACDAYGGCPFKVECGKSPIEKLGWTKGEHEMSINDFLAKLEAKRNGETPKTDPAPPPSTPAPVVLAPLPAPVAPAPTEPAPVAEARTDPPSPIQAKKGGRPKRVVVPPESAIVAEVQTGAGTTLFVDMEREAIQAEGPPIHTLFVNCLPTKGCAEGTPIAFSDMVARASARIKASDNVDHWSMLEYGKGAGALTKCVVDEVRTLTDAILVIDTKTPEGMHLVTALMPYAANVVRGL